MRSSTNLRYSTDTDVDEIDDYDIIHYASNNNFEGVDRVLAADPRQINAQSRTSGITPLIAATGYNLPDMVRHLLTKPGVDMDIRDYSGRAALDHAVLFPEVISILMEFRHPDFPWNDPGLHPV